jgi:hypothetical protein
MRFMVIVKADEHSEAGELPDEKIFAEMGTFNEELVKAGVMLAAEGLQPSSRGVRLHFSGGKTRVVDGPFAEAKELVAGYWIWQVKSKEEAIAWLRRSPFARGGEAVVELRPIYEADDLGEAFTPDLRAADARLREAIAARH